MKTTKPILSLCMLCLAIGTFISCENQDVNPSLVLDDVFIPKGFEQFDTPSMGAKAILDELRLENEDDTYFYLKLKNGSVSTRDSIMFAQKELKIEHIDIEYDRVNKKPPKYHGVVVKKIKGDWRNEEYKYYDQQPNIIGGLSALYAFIAHNLKYPEEAKTAGVEGKVFVEFVIGADGNIKESKVVKGIGHGCDQESIRVLKNAGKWIPGKVVDQPVDVRMILPITFKMG